MELGTRLAAELNDVSSPSITAKWMSWHLAEVMTAAETDSSKTQECAELILKLWRARRFLPSGDPFERYKEVLSALETTLECRPDFFIFGLFARSARNLGEQDLADLVREIRHHTHFLSLAALRLAVEREGLSHDDLIHLAHEVDRDAQTTILKSAQSITQEMRTESDFTRDERYVRKALDALQHLIDSYRQTYDNLTEKKD